MMRFKDFLTEESKENSSLHKVEYLPLHNGHAGVAQSADMLEGLHKILLGKNTHVKAQVDESGIPITFGYDPKRKSPFLAHKNMVSYTPQDIQTNHADNPVLVRKLTATMEHLPKIMPRGNKSYFGKVLYTDPSEVPDHIPPNVAKLGISVQTDDKGKPLTDTERRKFVPHPDVYMHDPKLQGNPERYNVDDQHNFLMHMKEARNCYSKMNPDALDVISGHVGSIQNHIDDCKEMGIEPNIKTYSDHVKQEYGGRVAAAPSSVIADQRSKRYASMAEQMMGNDKHFSSAIDLGKHLKNASDVLRNVSRSAGDIVLYHPDGTAVLKKPKKSVAEETNIKQKPLLNLKEYHLSAYSK